MLGLLGRTVAKLWDRLFLQLDRIESNTDGALHRLDALETQGEKNMSAIDDLQAQVTANANAEAAAVQLLQGLSQQLRDASSDPSKIQAIANQLHLSCGSLAAAIVANTPASSGTPVAPINQVGATPSVAPAPASVPPAAVPVFTSSATSTAATPAAPVIAPAPIVAPLVPSDPVTPLATPTLNTPIDAISTSDEPVGLASMKPSSPFTSNS